MIRRRSRRNQAPLAVLAVAAILSAVLAFQCHVAPSGHPSECAGSECAVEVAGASITVTPGPADNFSFEGATQPPPITAVSAAVVDDACGDLLFGKDAHRRLPPASITKIVTAIVAVETTEPDEMVTVNIDNFFAGDGTAYSLASGAAIPGFNGAGAPLLIDGSSTPVLYSAAGATLSALRISGGGYGPTALGLPPVPGSVIDDALLDRAGTLYVASNGQVSAIAVDSPGPAGGTAWPTRNRDSCRSNNLEFACPF